MAFEMKEGSYYLDGNGKVRGPMCGTAVVAYPFRCTFSGLYYTANGSCLATCGSYSPYDLVSECDKDGNPLTALPDMSENKIAFGLLSLEEQAALEAHMADGGTVKVFTSSGRWEQKGSFSLYEGFAYRTVPKPKPVVVTQTYYLAENRVPIHVMIGEVTHRLTITWKKGVPTVTVEAL